MKIESIHIQHFGHFVDFDLELGGSPFVLLFGRNEAGKTTLLEFLRQLLFGFPERTPYNFGDGGELGGSARLSLADHRVVELKRRKGRKNTLQARVAGNEGELDDAGFRQLLGNANENVFRTVFAFGLDELRTGNEGLKDESLQSALFGGGLGGALNPELLLKELEAEAGDLFRPSASKPAINALAAELRKMASEIKQHAIRPDEYEQRERSWKDAQAEADRLTAELGELRRRHARTERLMDALPRWLKLQALRAERQRMTIPEAFPRDAEHQFRTATDALRRLEREISAVKSESESSRQQLSVLQLDKTLLPLRAEIEECHRLIQSVTDARRDLPLRREERIKLREEIAAEVQRLRPGWTLDDLRTFSLPTAISHTLEELNRRELELNEERTRLQTRRDEFQAAGRQAEADLEALGAATDNTSLVSVLEQAVDFAADHKSLKKEQDECSKLLRSLESQRARLSPPLQLNLEDPGSLAAIQQLPVPPRELVQRFAAEMREVLQQGNAGRQAVAEAEKAREQVQREMLYLEYQQHSVPSLDELQQQRAERDSMWKQLREQHIERNAGGAAPHPDRFEQAVRNADQTADRIYEHADDVARREQLRRTLAELSTTLNRRQEEYRQVKKLQAEVEQRWRELWQPCGFEPLTCDLMLTWLDTFTSFVETHDVLAQRQVELASTQKRVDAFEERLRTVMENSKDDIKSLLTSAKLIAKNAEENAQQRKRLERDRKRFEKQLQGLADDLQKFGDADALWKSEWRQVLQKIGLPADWNANLARDVLGQLAAAREKLANLTELDRRIEQMEGRLAEFDPRVRRICEHLGEAVDPERPEINAASLQQRLAEATQAQERRTNLEAGVAKNQSSERELSAELNDWRTKREQLLARAAASSDEEFLAIAERTRRALELDSQIQDLCGQLAVARGHESDEAFSAVLDTADAGTLQAELAELTAKLNSQQVAADQARETAGSLRCQFEELDGSNMAALMQERMAQQQAKLATEIHRFVPLVFAKHLLQAAIKRFERENQPEMIKGISRMLATMTRGRYVEIERPTSDRAALYILGKDGTERSPDQLSTGTREQLYLAIRLGYVLHYCRQAEPLPIVMDDVLVNFDAERATATLEALRDVSQQAQILFFTCHQHVVDIVQQVFPGLQPLELSKRERQIEVAKVG